VTQSAGVRAVAGVPWNGTVGGTFYQAWNSAAYAGGTNFDQAQVFGADLSIPIPVLSGINFFGSWTQCNTLASSKAVAGTDNVDYLNAAMDGKFSAALGQFGVGLGYKDIGRNFAAAGYWDKIGRWTNPVNVKGPYADVTYPVMANLKVALNGEYLKVKDTIVDGMPTSLFGNKDDKVIAAEGGVKWGFTNSCSVDASYQWVKFDAQGAGSAATETYLTIGLTHQFCPNTGVKVGYQFISYNNGEGSGPYGPDYRGGLGVVQMGVTF
jgi:hypothetical protein